MSVFICVYIYIYREREMHMVLVCLFCVLSLVVAIVVVAVAVRLMLIIDVCAVDFVVACSVRLLCYHCLCECVCVSVCCVLICILVYLYCYVGLLTVSMMPWIRTTGVNTDGAAAKVMNFARFEQRHALACLGTYHQVNGGTKNNVCQRT